MKATLTLDGNTSIMSNSVSWAIKPNWVVRSVKLGRTGIVTVKGDFAWNKSNKTFTIKITDCNEREFYTLTRMVRK